MKGYTAAEWTVPDPRTGDTRHIFTGRLRILETAIHGKITVDILLEEDENEKNEKNGNPDNLYAAAPYTDAGAVEHVLDSSRFFVLRVVSEGRKALLGIGFEQRSDAWEFSDALQYTRRTLNIPDSAADSNNLSRRQNATTSTSLPSSSAQSTPADYSLKPGQKISINGGRRRPAAGPLSSKTSAREEEQALFSIAPPPAPGAVASFTTTSDQSTRRKRPTSAIIEQKPILGFEDSATFD
jgi:adaptin ear-binding coat-associated protein 1/2